MSVSSLYWSAVAGVKGVFIPDGNAGAAAAMARGGGTGMSDEGEGRCRELGLPRRDI